MKSHREYWRDIAMRQRARKKRILDYLRNKPCTDCQEWFNPWQMEFDHRDRTTKVGCISTILRTASHQTFLNELAKCDVVCANCHRNRTFRRGDQGHKDY